VLLCGCAGFLGARKNGGAAAIVPITRSTVSGKEPVSHHVIVCTLHQPGTTNSKCESIEMIIARGLPIASGFMAFDCELVVKSG
jgi:hypothetical protein